MNSLQPESTITLSCPSGHRLRGRAAMVGKTVKCPRCDTPFVFAPTKSSSDNRKITDTGVMRILGDIPKPPTPAEPSQIANRSVTDTGVMRILGEVPGPVPSQPPSPEAPKRPCSRCGVGISESLAICPHCNCYVGVMPTYMQELTGDREASSN